MEELYQVALETGASIVGGRVRLALPPDKIANISNVCRRVLRENDFYKVVHKYEGKKLPGAGNVLIDRKVFDSIGLFDESIVVGAPDCDFFLRARHAGINMIYTPKASIHHRISPKRLTPEYFRWDTSQTGGQLAYLDYKYKGIAKMLFFLLARMGQAILINLPLLLIAQIGQNPKEALDRKCLLWQAIGYVRRGLFFISPRLFAQEQFFTNLNFRKPREITGALTRDQQNNGSNIL